MTGPAPAARRRRRRAITTVTVAGTLALFALASTASALILTGGPTYTLPGGGSCTVSGVASQTGGATVTCSAVVLSAHTNVYFGIRNDINVNGNTMTGTAPAASTGAVFTYASNTSTSITYGSTTTINDLLNGSQTVTNKMVLTLTSGTGTVVATGGIPGNNGNGGIDYVFHITGLSAGAFTVRVDVQASNPLHSLGYAATAVYDPTHTPTTGASEFSKVDLGFYYSDCGDGTVDSPEQCDLGVNNGSSTSCCTSACQYRASGQVCRIGAGPPCDANETCTGLSSSCPSDDALIHGGVVCRTGSGDICDQNETCTGVAGQGCPADDAPGKLGTICRLSTTGDICDESETCTGVPGATCPVDDAPSKANVVCRAGSGDICDPDEKCTGVAGQGCPPDVVANPTTLCRAGSGDVCDPDELCTAVPGAPCPADVVTPSGTVCRPAAGECDVAEQCSGNAGETCPANAFVAATTSCNEDADVCTTDECDGSGNCAFVENLNCDDSNSCTQDSCDAINGCQYSGAPATTCLAGTRAVFKYKDSTTDSRDKVTFLWKGGPSLVEDMGDPTQTTRYELCIYDNTGVQMAMGVPPGAGWEASGSPSSPKGYKYKDKNAASEGIKLIKTKGSSLGKAKVKVVGKGDALPDTAILPFQFPVTAQLYASDGMCWEAEFGAGQSKKNDDGKFIGKTP